MHGTEPHARRRNELGMFLRARRENLSPADVGLPERGRRRTPGLRREEVATLAGVSVDYLTRLEQGRDAHPSAEVVNALAAALRLSQDERLHLGKLATIPRMAALCPEPAEPGGVSAAVGALLDRLDPTPAFVIDGLSNVLAWNPTWAALATPMGYLDGDRPNIARYVYTHPSARTVYGDWEHAADEQAGRLRTAAGLRCPDPALDELLAELRSVPDFARRWDAYTVAEKRAGAKDLRHPQLGLLRIEYQVLSVVDTGHEIVTWLPADQGTAAVLDSFTDPRPESPARLRVVGGD